MKYTVVLGAGESGLGAALLAKKRGYKVFVSDSNEIKETYKNELSKNEIPFEEKGHNLEIIGEADLLVKSPGIPNDAKIIRSLRNRGVKIISEVEFSSRFTKAKIIAVTGSNGKTTVSSLIHHLLVTAGEKAVLAGNIGVSFSRILAEEQSFDYAVLEVSSFQLDDIESFKPHIAVILNVTPDHLDRYAFEMENYARAKWNITRNQDSSDFLIVNADDEWINKMIIGVGSISKLAKLSVNNFNSDTGSKDLVHNLKGKHNEFNIGVALEVMKILRLDHELMKKGIRSFRAIEHRLESVAIINGVEFINDSKATNVDSVYYALEAMTKPVIWIAGGTDKGNNYSALNQLVAQKVKALVALGIDNTKLTSAFSNQIEELISTKSIEAAIKEAVDKAERGDVVLLSPACASFDLFNNYEHRGEMFKKEVLKLLD